MLEPWQAALLRKKAKELSVSESQLLQVALPCIAELHGIEGVDERVWEQVAASFEGWRTRRTAEIARGWYREELYEDRLARSSRPWIERLLGGAE